MIYCLAMKHKPKRICSIEGCEKAHFGKDLCNMHYHRVRNGISDMRVEKLPSPKWKTDDPRFNKSHCSVLGCEKPFYAKELCRKHWALNNRTGALKYRKDIFIKCNVDSCVGRAGYNGYCPFHLERKRNGVELTRPKGVKGKLNPRWNEGSSQYPNHYKMKKNRLIILKKAKYICHYCGGKATQIHHKDLFKDNHEIGNLAASCCKCNRQKNKIYTSKYKRLYGKTIAQLCQEMGTSPLRVKRLHDSGMLATFFNDSA